MRLSNIRLPRLTFWQIVLLIILPLGLFSTFVRFTQGLGATTNLSDEFPWGLWIGFDVLCGVALAAGGFTISAAVYVFHIERFKPVVRPAILTAFLGYGLVIVAILFDLGRGDRIWHPLVMWNPNSVMFEVGWCVMLYSTVLAFEFSPLLFERLGWQKPLRMAKSAMLPLVIMGILLSTLHQSSLGSLYLIVPGKLHPLWYSPLLPVFFFVSAVALGCAMTIFESFLSFRAFRKRLELDILSTLAKVLVVALAVYLILRFNDLNARGALWMAFQPTYEARLFLAEILLGVVGPIVLLSIASIRTNDFGLFVSSVLAISGFMMNRLNVSITGLEASAGRSYSPTWMEIAVTLSLVSAGFVFFSLAVKYVEVFPKAEGGELAVEKVALPAVNAFRAPFASPTKVAMVLAVVIFAAALLLGLSGLGYRKTGAMVAPNAPTATLEAHLQPRTE